VKRSWILAAICGVLAAAGNGCSSERTVSAANATRVAAPQASTQAAEHSQIYQASGPLVVENQVDVAAQREGVVAKILADVGRRVRKGQVLAQLDDRQLTAERDAAAADLRASNANLKNWEAESKVLDSDLQRDQALWDSQLITQQQLEHTKYKAAAAKFQRERDQQNLIFYTAKLRSAEMELGKTHITAPFDGVVARRYVREGQKVAVNDRLFWVTATAPLNVRFTLPQEFVDKVKVGDVVQVSAPFENGEKHTAKVTLISPVVDPASGTIELQAQVTGPPKELRPGMTVNIQVKAQ
jgi:RND family efflux transporter MFP subunit